MKAMTTLRQDIACDCRFHIRQPEGGYRFSMDAVLLGREVRLNPQDRVLDLGTGCGIIALILARRRPDAVFFGVELQPDLAEIARENVRANQMEDRITILCGDIRRISPDLTQGPVDVAVCNPPHIPSNCGRLNPLPEIAMARHEITVTLNDLIDAARRMLSPAGRFILIYPAARKAAVLNKLQRAGIEPKHVRMIHTKPDAAAKRFIVEAVIGSTPGVTEAPPLFL